MKSKFLTSCFFLLIFMTGATAQAAAIPDEQQEGIDFGSVFGFFSDYANEGLNYLNSFFFDTNSSATSGGIVGSECFTNLDQMRPSIPFLSQGSDLNDLFGYCNPRMAYTENYGNGPSYVFSPDQFCDCVDNKSESNGRSEIYPTVTNQNREARATEIQSVIIASIIEDITEALVEDMRDYHYALSAPEFAILNYAGGDANENRALLAGCTDTELGLLGDVLPREGICSRESFEQIASTIATVKEGRIEDRDTPAPARISRPAPKGQIAALIGENIRRGNLGGGNNSIDLQEMFNTMGGEDILSNCISGGEGEECLTISPDQIAILGLEAAPYTPPGRDDINRLTAFDDRETAAALQRRTEGMRKLSGLAQYMLENNGDLTNRALTSEELGYFRIMVRLSPFMRREVVDAQMSVDDFLSLSDEEFTQRIKPHLTDTLYPSLRSATESLSAQNTDNFTSLFMAYNHVYTRDFYNMLGQCREAQSKIMNLCAAIDSIKQAGPDQAISAIMSNELLLNAYYEGILPAFEGEKGTEGDSTNLLLDSSSLICREHSERQMRSTGGDGGSLALVEVDSIPGIAEYLAPYDAERQRVKQDFKEPASIDIVQSVLTNTEQGNFSAIFHNVPDTTRQNNQNERNNRRQSTRSNILKDVLKNNNFIARNNPSRKTPTAGVTSLSQNVKTGTSRGASESISNTPASNLSGPRSSDRFSQSNRSPASTQDRGVISNEALAELGPDDRALAEHLNRLSSREDELMRRIRELEAGASASADQERMSEQEKLIQQLREDINRLRAEISITAEDVSKSDEGKKVITDAFADRQYIPPAAQIESGRTQNLGGATFGQNYVENRPASNITPTSFASTPITAPPTALGANRGAGGRPNTVGPSGASAVSPLVLTQSTLNASDSNLTQLALSAETPVVYLQGQRPGEVLKIVFETSPDGRILFNEFGEPIIEERTSISMSEAEIAQWMARQEGESGRRPASVVATEEENLPRHKRTTHDSLIETLNTAREENQ